MSNDDLQPELQGFNEKFQKYRYKFERPVLLQHLAFLNAIRLFVAAAKPTPEDEVTETNPETAHRQPPDWLHVWISKAIYRFELWLKNVRPGAPPGTPDQILPPLDVLLVLSGYYLSPMAFSEDSDNDIPGRWRTLNGTSFPLQAVESRVDRATGQYHSLQIDIDAWATAGVPFDLANMDPHVKIRCPKCDTKHTVPWKSSDGTKNGYGERNFRFECCITITNDALSAAKFANDMYLCRKDEKAIPRRTLFDLHGNQQPQYGRAVFKRFQEIIPKLPNNWNAQDVGDKLDWSILKLVRLIGEADPDGKDPLPVHSYKNRYPFTNDMLNRTHSLIDFARQMEAMRWIGGDVHHELGNHLVVAIERYRTLLLPPLRTRQPSVFADYPQDLVWHTHQFVGDDYRKQIVDLVRLFIDHRTASETTNHFATFNARRTRWHERHYPGRFNVAEVSTFSQIDVAEAHTPCCISCDYGADATKEITLISSAKMAASEDS